MALSLGEFVAAVADAESESAAARLAVTHAAEALDADVAAIVAGEDLLALVGFPEGFDPTAELIALEPGAEGSLAVPGIGPCALVPVALEHPPGARFVVGRAGDRLLNEQETQLLRAIAGVTSMTMRTHRLLDEERAARHQLERVAGDQVALRRMATLVAGAAPRDEVYGAVAEELARRQAADVVVLLRYDAGHRATVVGGWGVPGIDVPLGERFEVGGEGVAIAVSRTHRPAYVGRLEGPPGSVAAWLQGLGIRTGIGSPIVVEDELWGVAVAASRRPGALPAGSEARTAEFTELVATAIANTQAREELGTLAAEQAALRRVATLVAQTVPPEAVFAAVAEQVGRLFAPDSAGLVRFEPDDTLTVLATWGHGAQIRAGFREPISDGTLSKLVRDTGRAGRIEYGPSGPAVIAAAGLRWGVGAPVILGGRLWGVMTLVSANEEPPAGTEERLVAFSELIATALVNAHSRAELEQSRTETKRFAEEQLALRRVATLVAQGVPPAKIFDAVTEEIHQLWGADRTGLARHDPDGLWTVLAVRGGVSERGRVGSRVDLGVSMPGLAELVNGRPVRVDAAPEGTPVDHVIRAEHVQAWVASPILLKGKTWGQVAVSSRHGPLPVGAEQRLANFTELVATALANAEAQGELTASRARIVASADEARRRIVRDLHDSAQQRLVHTIIALKLAQRAHDSGDEEAAGELMGEALDHAEHANTELRELVYGILPNVLSRRGLAASVAELTRRLRIPTDVDVTGDRLPIEIEATAYFLIAEALTNVAKHSGAKTAQVRAQVADGALEVDVRDDGVGGAQPEGGGLRGLADRLVALGGDLRIDSPDHGGTRITGVIPLPR